jgi:CopG antitoxin of type II toxin-antitoxin system
MRDFQNAPGAGIAPGNEMGSFILYPQVRKSGCCQRCPIARAYPTSPNSASPAEPWQWSAPPGSCQSHQLLSSTFKSISLRLPESMLDELRQLANERDIPYQSLIKHFLRERIDQEYKVNKS